MRALLALVAFLSVVVAATVVRAADLPGQDAPRFEAALELWLADDEETALPELAALAAEGNRAAQVLLARIDATPTLQGPWLQALPRAERNALMRAPGGLSGRSWMHAAAEDTPLAQLWLVQPTPEATGETALAFAALGEARAARDTLYALSRRQYRGYAAFADDPNFPPELRYFVWREWAEVPALRSAAEAEIAATHPGDPQLARYDFRPIDPAAFEDWLASAQLAAPLRTMCATTCPATAGSCALAAFELLGGRISDISGHGGLASLGPPSETLVPTERWNASARGHATILRQSDVRFRDAESPFDRVAAADACLGAALAAETARFAD